jgi:hypothetical protein
MVYRPLCFDFFGVTNGQSVMKMVIVGVTTEA